MARPQNAYVHVPFCRRLCPYCDFFVVVEKRGQRAQFLERLIREIGEETADGGPLETIHFGGGTPSELELDELRAILEALGGRFGIAADVEIALEANPEGLDAGRVEGLREAGVTRLSLGVQSFDAEALRWLGRSHSAEEARRAVEWTTRAGFESFGVDLIHGVPGLDAERSLASVQTAIELGAPHLSHYGLTYHEETRLGRKLAAGRIRPMAEELEADIFEAAAALMQTAGFEHYEVSNFARPGHRSRHNLACWKGEEYLAFGPSAVGYTGGRRWKRASTLQCWQTGQAREIEPVDARTAEVESVIAGLRLVRDGLSLKAFQTRHGRDVRTAFPEATARGVELEMLEIDSDRMRLSGMRAVLLYDSVLSLFIGDER